MTDIERFWSKTRAKGACLIWTGTTSKSYGKFRSAGKLHRAHRWIYEKVFGPIGDKKLLHSCDKGGCVALQHLSPGTQKQNMQEASSKSRMAYKLTPEEVASIRFQYSTGVYNQYELADLFGISQQHISKIVRGERR